MQSRKPRLSGAQFATYLGYLEGTNNLLGEKVVAPQPQNGQTVIIQKIYVRESKRKSLKGINV